MAQSREPRARADHDIHSRMAAEGLAGLLADYDFDAAFNLVVLPAIHRATAAAQRAGKGA